MRYRLPARPSRQATQRALASLLLLAAPLWLGLSALTATVAGASTTGWSCFISYNSAPGQNYEIACGVQDTTNYDTIVFYWNVAGVEHYAFIYATTSYGGSGYLPHSFNVVQYTADTSDCMDANGDNVTCGAATPGTNTAAFIYAGGVAGGGSPAAGTVTTSTGTVIGKDSVSFSDGVAADCNLLSVTGYTTALQMGNDYVYTFAFTGRVDDIVIELPASPDFTTNPGNFSNSLTLESKSFGNAFSAPGPHLPDDQPIDVNLTNMQIGSTGGTYIPNTGVEAWCYAPSTGWVDWGDLMNDAATSGGPSGLGGGSGTNPGGDGGAFSFASCAASDPIGLNPASWVPAIVNWGTCAVRWVFQPSTSAVTGLEDTFGVTNNPISNTANCGTNGTGGTLQGASSASQWLGAIGTIVSFGPTESALCIQADFNAGATSPVVDAGPTIHYGGSHGTARSFTANIPTIIAGLAASPPVTSAITVVNALGSVFLLVMFCILIIWLFRKILSRTS